MSGSETEPHIAENDESSVDVAADHGRPNPAQKRYLMRGLAQPGGKLPLFDEHGQHNHPALVRACIAHGWAEPWFGNPMKPDWLVCRLTEKGRQVLAAPGNGH